MNTNHPTTITTRPTNLPQPATSHLPPWLKTLLDPAHETSLIQHYGPYVITAALAVTVTATLARSLLWRWRSHRHARNAYLIEIAVPAQVEPDSAAAWWARLSGLLSPWWKRALYGQPHLAFEYVADTNGVHFQVWVPGTIPPALIEKTLTTAWPGATLTVREPAPPLPLQAPSAGGRMILGRAEHFPLLAKHPADPLRALLGALEGLSQSEHAAVQLLVRPSTGRRLRHAHRAASAMRGARSAAPQALLFDLVTPGATGHPHPSELTRMFPERDEEVRAILAKAREPRFEVQIRYAVATDRTTAKAARGWLRARAHEIASTFALYASGHQHLRRSRLRTPAKALASRHMSRGYLLSAGELAALAHLPYDDAAPGVTRAGARPVAPSPMVPATAPGPMRVLGDAEAGPPRPVALTVKAARQHLHVIGKTGVGKSTFLANLILSDAHAGRGALLIDPKGDLVDDILDRLPERAIGRTVVFDPAQQGPPPCINVLASEDPNFAADAIVTTFRRCFSSAWGPRMDDLMRSACLTLAKVHGTTANLGDLPRLLTDHIFRAAIVSRLEDTLLRGFWDSYDELSPGSQASVISPVMNKLRAVLLRPFVRDALSGSASTVNIGRLLDNGGLILARLPKGVLGDDATSLFGSLLLAHAWQAVTPRCRIPEKDRRDAALYVDEAQNFLHLPGSVIDILDEARAYHLSFVMAHHNLSQLPKDLREAVSANALNKVYFAVSPEDATDLGRHVAPLVTPHDLSHLGAFQAVGRIMNDNQQSPPFTLRTRPLPEAIPGRQEAVRTASAKEHAPHRPLPHGPGIENPDRSQHRENP